MLTPLTGASSIGEDIDEELERGIDRVYGTLHVGRTSLKG
jgi:hypothetical protein